MKTFSLLLTALVSAGVAAAGGDETPTSAPKTQAVVVGTQETIKLRQGWFEEKGGSHLLLLSNLEEPSWKKIQPGETLLVVVVHGEVQPGNFTTKGSGEAFRKLLERGELDPTQAFSALLYTNTSKSEPVFLMQILDQALKGKHLLSSGAVTVRGSPELGRALLADFALVFDGVSVAGRVSVRSE